MKLDVNHILVANSKSHEIRVFDAEGRLLHRIGRRGAGPGEFLGDLKLEPVPGSNDFMVYDRVQDRISRFDTLGKLVALARTDPANFTGLKRATFIYRSNWVIGSADTGGQRRTRTVLREMGDPPPGGYRYVWLADDGRLWSQVRFAGDSAESWQVLSSEAKLISTIDIPRYFEIHQIGEDFILGRRWDADDVEHIQVLGFGPGNKMASLPIRAPVEADSGQLAAARDALTAALRNLVMAQEMYYADSNKYATRSSALTWDAGGGALHLMAADQRGWVGGLVSETAPQLCGMAVGSSTPAGWQEGFPECGAVEWKTSRP
jgi:hypothetical protein